MSYDFSIGITSYNRVNELLRCLQSIDVVKHNIEIIISEDNSPKKEEIKEIVGDFSKKSRHNIIFNSNDSNLGYDNNLEKIIELAKGKYVLLMSDDDYFINGALDTFIESVMKSDACLAFSPFVQSENPLDYRRKYACSFHIPAGVESVKKYHMDSILFSGLAFKRDLIKDISAKRFLNHYYFQVYLFMTVMNKYGGDYIDVPLVRLMSDGENAFGKTESSIKNADLANRKSIFSNLEFTKGLIKVIRCFDQDNGTKVIDAQADILSFRIYPELALAKKQGKKVYLEYKRRLHDLDINLSWYVGVYEFMLNLLGVKLCDSLMIPLKNITLELMQRRRG